jgi:hypothetical protein
LHCKKNKEMSKRDGEMNLNDSQKKQLKKIWTDCGMTDRNIHVSDTGKK